MIKTTLALESLLSRGFVVSGVVRWRAGGSVIGCSSPIFPLDWCIFLVEGVCCGLALADIWRGGVPSIVIDKTVPTFDLVGRPGSRACLHLHEESHAKLHVVSRAYCDDILHAFMVK